MTTVKIVCILTFVTYLHKVSNLLFGLEPSDLANVMDIEELHEANLNIKLTNKGTFLYGSWSKEKLLSLLKKKLLQQHKIELSTAYPCNDAQCDASFESYHSIIHSGTYNECILVELGRKGMSPRKIMKALKFGLLSLSPEELKYFQNFGVKMDVLNDADMWSKKLNEKLIWNLIVAGLTENQCWNIVVCGLVSQDESVLCHLLLSGIDVSGVLNWPGQIKPITSTIITFLKKLGIDENTLHYVEENGIDDEVEDMLIDLGFSEYEERQALEEILCECSLSILESTALSLKTSRSASLNGTASTVSMQFDFAPCTCYLSLLSRGQDYESFKRKNYLRQSVMVPLTWAISRALRYQPTNPQYYIAHQLLRWRYGNVSQEEIDNAQQFVIAATIAMDHKLLKKREREEEDIIRHLNKIAEKNIICDKCLERQKLQQIKEHCWKCTRVSTLTYNE